ncbi:lytic transglycosylase domain-containing protein [Vibrio splendidus]
MFELPPNLPTPVKAPERVVNTCIAHASKHYGVSPLVMKSLTIVEGGKVGTTSLNSNKTYDLGIMQINTIHLPAIANKFPGVTWREVTYSPCINIGIGAWLLSKRMSETTDFWSGVGNYHSKTPKYRDRYLKKVKAAYANLILKYRG